jgi:hypothetical protein
MNFARCDARAMQSLMQNGGYAPVTNPDAPASPPIAPGRCSSRRPQSISPGFKFEAPSGEFTQAERASWLWLAAGRSSPAVLGSVNGQVDVSSLEEGPPVGRKPSTRAPLASVSLKND